MLLGLQLACQLIGFELGLVARAALAFELSASATTTECGVLLDALLTASGPTGRPGETVAWVAEALYARGGRLPDDLDIFACLFSDLPVIRLLLVRFGPHLVTPAIRARFAVDGRRVWNAPEFEEIEALLAASV